MNRNAKDIISKEIIKCLIEDIAKYLFDIELKSLDVLETQLHRCEERRADILVKVAERGEIYLLHIEIQNNNEADIAQRMLRYRIDFSLQWPGFEIEQYLIYIGKGKMTMPDHIEQKRLQYHYHVIDMHRIDCEYFLHADTPEALILAILCDFKGREEKQVVQWIIRELKRYHQDNEKGFRNAIAMLEVLSVNRDLQHTVREEEKMLSVTWDQLPSYEIGMEQGLEKGKMEGILENQTQVVINAQKAGLDTQTISQITGLTPEQIQAINQQSQ